MPTKTELWDGHPIRFTMHAGEWYAVAKDITDALGYLEPSTALRNMPSKYKGLHRIQSTSEKTKAPLSLEVITLTEQGIYRLIMRSNKPKAEAFQDWVFQVIKKLREASGLEGFQIFRMMDKQHQKRTMAGLTASLKQPLTVDYIKANIIADKAVSNMFGLPKMLKKPAMTPEMLKARQPVLTDTAELMSVKDKFNLDVSISSAIYRKYSQKKDAAK
ncbi:BRO-N domain-containing protein [Lacticaseibacillus rhamnosus]|uniref:BRO-N domain-containing protein n=1 Tax=Lacticaseibacillus rhamnosus TaxID=47715 RepID=UPI00237F98E4|nr:Bro-N domain-containing protein [Lacticaseibacillus rhamnosus]MDE3295709.1 Bro-N domain-containing protein [Lacticaseibacillus rhamnosus]